ncbi:hypothetical protein NMG60_11029092 [Bertholletia excelsa]
MLLIRRITFISGVKNRALISYLRLKTDRLQEDCCREREKNPAPRFQTLSSAFNRKRGERGISEKDRIHHQHQAPSHAPSLSLSLKLFYFLSLRVAFSLRLAPSEFQFFFVKVV